MNESGLFALRGRQEGSRRSRRTTTTTIRTTTSTTTPRTSTPSESALAVMTLTSVATRGVVEPAALLSASNDQTLLSSGSPSGSPPSSNYPSKILLSTSQNRPNEIAVKPQSKIVLPCDLEGNHTRVLSPRARLTSISSIIHLPLILFQKGSMANVDILIFQFCFRNCC